MSALNAPADRFALAPVQSAARSSRYLIVLGDRNMSRTTHTPLFTSAAYRRTRYLFGHCDFRAQLSAKCALKSIVDRAAYLNAAITKNSIAINIVIRDPV